ncbi:hypothetical protein EB75_26510 [Mycobacterium sp. ST-F2]|nr:hypothetical protein EB75_26510 [Mycobacterium sp. ST-F2]
MVVLKHFQHGSGDCDTDAREGHQRREGDARCLARALGCDDCLRGDRGEGVHQAHGESADRQCHQVRRPMPRNSKPGKRYRRRGAPGTHDEYRWEPGADAARQHAAECGAGRGAEERDAGGQWTEAAYQLQVQRRQEHCHGVGDVGDGARDDQDGEGRVPQQRQVHQR